ncbi:MAG TPA: cytochrome c [Usitatibacter sp.]|nr:cytochrome c [Usitatibacter sp.]
MMLRAVVIASLAAAALVAGCVSTGEAPAPSAPPAPRSFDAAQVARGATLAAIGNCRSCHTAPDGKSFAGGVPFRTPFGTVYSTNITPDADTGIGRWTEADFIRAMREGVDRGGRHLYPVFPYDHFTHVTDEDNRAIYAYVMTRPAVRATNRRNELMFPFNIRATLAMWKALYFKPEPLRDDPSLGREANRGAYLVEGLGHCGACHTPRNGAGAEIRARNLDGGEAEGWHAYAINDKSQAPTRWTVEAMTAYLKRGWHDEHGVSRGPMAAVTDDLADVPDGELRAISAYLVARMASASPPPALPPAKVDAGGGGALYAATCASCHDGTQPLPFGGITLPMSIGVAGESPLNLVNVILYGLPPAEGQSAPLMPGFAGALTDAQVADLARWMRARFTRKGPWQDVEAVVRKAREHGAEGARYAAGGNGVDPAAIAERQ